MMEKLGGALGPILGGIVATLFGGQYIFLVAALLLIIGIVPLFRTAEPVRTRQHLDFKSLKIEKLKPDFLSFAAAGTENTVSIFLWSLYLGLFVLAGSTVYIKLGLLSSISVIVAIVSAKAIGQLIDGRKGMLLLHYGTKINAFVHLLRPFILSYPLAFVLSIVNEAVTTSYRMPYFKGLYDAADDHSGQRIVYLTALEIFSSLCKAIMWWLLVLVAVMASSRLMVVTGFGIAALSSLLIMSERFRALNNRKVT